MMEFLNIYLTGWQSSLAGVVVSIILASLVLPWVFERRDFKSLVHARAILISRSDALHQSIADYAAALAANDGAAVSTAREALLYSLQKFMRIPSEFSPIMRGKIGAAYFAYRFEATWLIGAIAKKFNDYDAGFSEVLPDAPPEHHRAHSPVEADRLYRHLFKVIGKDAVKIPNWRRIVNGWSADQKQTVTSAFAEKLTTNLVS